YSTDVATIFLDSQLSIRFFSPPAQHLFKVKREDVGRSLKDLSSMAVDSTLVEDATKVLSDSSPSEKEICAPDGTWHLRRIYPTKGGDFGVAGIVVTFSNITERRQAT